jgi:hypothetical protein
VLSIPASSRPAVPVVLCSSYRLSRGLRSAFFCCVAVACGGWGGVVAVVVVGGSTPSPEIPKL